MVENPLKYVFIISDGTGATASKVLDAALAHFKDEKTIIETYPQVRESEEITRVLELAQRKKAFIVHTLVESSTRNILVQRANVIGLEHCDIISALIHNLSAFFKVKPDGTPGIKRNLDEQYFKTIDAIEYAVKNDDGQEPAGLLEADIVLIGLSRTSKTPLSIYLAHKGFKVANIPLIPGIEPPKDLYEVDKRRVFGLTIDKSALLQIRKNRLKTMGLNNPIRYANEQNVRQELLWCKRLYESNSDWTVINVTHRAVEETAAIVLKQINGLSPNTEKKSPG